MTTLLWIAIATLSLLNLLLYKHHASWTVKRMREHEKMNQDRLESQRVTIMEAVTKVSTNLDDAVISFTNRITEEIGNLSKPLYELTNHFNDLQIHVQNSDENQENIDADFRHEILALIQHLDALPPPDFHQMLADALVKDKHLLAEQKKRLHVILQQKRAAKAVPPPPPEEPVSITPDREPEPLPACGCHDLDFRPEPMG